MMSFLSERSRRPEWALLFLALWVLGIGLGLRDPWPADEPRFVLVAKQMWESGDWLFPMRGNEFYPDKPPLFFWLLNLAYAVCGSWRSAFLLPALLSSVAVLALVHDLVRRLHGLRAARLAVLLLLFVVQFSFQMKRAQIDPVLVALMTAAHYGLLRHLLLGPAWGWATFGAACAGLATITKGVGPLSLLLLPACALAARLAPRRLPQLRWRDWRWAWLALAFFGALAVWLVPLLILAQDQPPRLDYVRQILLGQTAQRYLAPASHVQPFWYFAEVIALHWIPFSLLLPWVLPAWRRRLQRSDGRLATLLLHMGLVLLFFSLTPGKRDVYILPLLPIAVIAAAPLLPGLLVRSAVLRMLWGLSVGLGLVLCVAAVWGAFGDPRWASRAAVLVELKPWGLIGLIGGGMLVLALLCWRQRLLAWPLVMTWMWSVLALGAYPLLDDRSSARGLLRTTAELIGPNAELGLLNWKEQILLQVDRPAKVFGFLRNRAAQELDAVAWLRERPQQRWLLVQPVNLEACFDPLRARPVGRSNRRDWLLVQADALLPVCHPHPDSARLDRRIADF